jgi:hypothetical protein
VVVLTTHAEPELAVQAFRAGATGYLLKLSPGEELVRAIEEVSRGRVYLSLITKDLINVMVEAKGSPTAGRSTLKPRQREVLQLIAEGRTMKEIASTLLHIPAHRGDSYVRYDGSSWDEKHSPVDPIRSVAQVGSIRSPSPQAVEARHESDAPLCCGPRDVH